MTRDDVVRITEAVLSELHIVVYSGSIDPNRREIKLMLGDREISQAWFDVAPADEYRG